MNSGSDCSNEKIDISIRVSVAITFLRNKHRFRIKKFFEEYNKRNSNNNVNSTYVSTINTYHLKKTDVQNEISLSLGTFQIVDRVICELMKKVHYLEWNIEDKNFKTITLDSSVDIDWESKANMLKGTWKGFSFNGLNSHNHLKTVLNIFTIKINADLTVECNTEHRPSLRGELSKILDSTVGIDLKFIENHKITRKISMLVRIGHDEYRTTKLLKLAYLDSGPQEIRYGKAILIRSDVDFTEYELGTITIETLDDKLTSFENKDRINIDNEIHKILGEQHNIIS